MYQLISETSAKHLPTGTVFALPPVESFGFDYVQWLAAGGVPEQPPAPPDPTPAEAARIIDAAAGQIVHDVVDGRVEEYRQAEEEARAWKAAGYTGQAPAGVATWSAASGMAAPAACDNIIAQADAWRAALMQIRGARLSAKAVAAQGNVEQALAQWAAFEAVIRQTLGIAPVVVPT